VENGEFTECHLLTDWLENSSRYIHRCENAAEPQDKAVIERKEMIQNLRARVAEELKAKGYRWEESTVVDKTGYSSIEVKIVKIGENRVTKHITLTAEELRTTIVQILALKAEKEVKKNLLKAAITLASDDTNLEKELNAANYLLHFHNKALDPWISPELGEKLDNFLCEHATKQEPVAIPLQKALDGLKSLQDQLDFLRLIADSVVTVDVSTDGVGADRVYHFQYRGVGFRFVPDAEKEGGYLLMQL
jgi:ribosomal protein S8E